MDEFEDEAELLPSKREDERVTLLDKTEDKDPGSYKATETGPKPWFSFPDISPDSAAFDDEANKTNYIQTFFNIVNANLGTGILAMPFVLRLGGWWGVLTIFLVGLLGNHTAKLLIDLMYVETTDGQKRRIRFAYHEIGEEFHPVYGRNMVHVANCFDQFSHCALLLIMCGQVLYHTFPNLSVNEAEWTAICALAVIPTVFLRNMRQLAWLSMITVLSALVISACVVCYSLSKSGEWSHSRLPPFRIHTVPIGLGVVMVTYSSQAYLPAMEKSTQNREEFKKLLNITYAFVTLIKFGVGILVYLSFEDKTDQIMTLNLPHGGFRIVMCIAVTALALLFYTVPIYTIFDIVENQLHIPWLAFNYTNEKAVILTGMALRAVLLGFTIVLGVAVPHFSLLMSFIGSLTGQILVIIYPCLFHIKINYDRLEWHSIALNCAIIGFAVIGGILGVVYSSLALYTVYNETWRAETVQRRKNLWFINNFDLKS